MKNFISWYAALLLVPVTVTLVQAHEVTQDESCEVQRCADDACPCSENCRCIQACRCRSTGCRGCCQANLEDETINKSLDSSCVAQLCDCQAGCCKTESCCQ